MVPKKIFFTKGVGCHKEKLASFELALREAGIEKFNLVSVSSIFPPKCEIVKKEDGLKELKPGEIVYCVLARCETNETNRLTLASVGCAIPADNNTYGYLSEHHGYGESETEAGDYAEDLAACMLASTLGIDFDPDKDWNEKEEVFKMSGKIVNTTNITQTALGKNAFWTTVIAVAVFIE